jgi:acetylornithine deacetylase/succinyl-diaminopimelate desuccinylase-like protein
VIVRVGAMRTYGGKPPVGIRIVIEGREEYGSPLDTCPLMQPELLRADAIVVADAGQRSAWGVPG